MNRKRMIHVLDKEFNKWIESIKDDNVRKLARENSFITGGAFISLMDNKEPNDFDIYFKNYETALAVTNYYVGHWNKHKHGGDKSASIIVDEETASIKVRVASAGITGDKDEKKKKDESSYRPVFLSDNAITLSDKIQLIIRFYGEPEEVHKNFDFVHCTCYYDPSKSKLVMPSEALESYIFKELKYVGSKYPIASILRSRKFIKRGWKINAGQYLKMVFQLQDFDLQDTEVLADQLNGVDLFYMEQVVDAIREKKVAEPDFELTSTYLVEVVERIFDEGQYDEGLHGDLDN